MKQIILLVSLFFSLETRASEYCINEKIDLKGSSHHMRISNSDDYELSQISKYHHVVLVKHPTNNELELVIDGHKKFLFIPQANCDDLAIDI